MVVVFEVIYFEVMVIVGVLNCYDIVSWGVLG